MGTPLGAVTPPAQPRKGWFGRNWKWFVPAGCLFIFLLVAGGIGGILAIVEGSIKQSGAYTQALAQAQANPQVTGLIGQPVTPGMFVSGNINVNGDSGDADISIPVSGPKGKGKVYAVAKKSAGQWQFQTLQFGADGQADRIDLLQAQAAAPTTASAAAQPPADPAGSAAAPTAPGGVIASAQFSNDPNLRCDLLEVKRVSGNALLVRWRLINTGAKGVGYDFDWPQLYYTDPAENKKYAFLTDSSGARVLDMWWGTLGPGEQRLQWAKFPAPPATSKKITVYIPKFMPFEDVPVGP
ncbi:MAG: cytochrome c oxidase assembly factor Coa1 family protein [Acidobacteriaceae bacterium]